MKILAGDVVGTKTRLALFELEGGLLNPVAVEIFPSREFKSLDLIVRRFLEKHKSLVEHACFGIAGPVKSRRSETSNLVWVVDALQ